MTEETRFTIGADATCSDGTCGEVIRVVVDPVALAITHLVVEPKQQEGLARLVPLELLDKSEGDEIRIRCTLVEFDNLESAEETEFLPVDVGYAGYGPDQVFRQPYYHLGLAEYGGFTLGDGAQAPRHPKARNSRQVVTHDTLPSGEVGIRRGDHVHATDGELGKVQGLVIDPQNHHVTHVLLQEGHLFGRKNVAIPITDVVGFDDGIRLKLTVEQVRDLPRVNVDRLDS